MNSSLKITADENGYYRHPEGHPLVVIFDSKHGAPKTTPQISWQIPVIGLSTHEPGDGTLPSNEAEANGDDIGTPKFVNISRPADRGKRAKKKSLGSHTSQNPQRAKRKSEKFAKTSGVIVCKKRVQSNESSSSSEPQSIPLLPSTKTDPFAVFPVVMEPYMDILLHRYFALVPNVSKSPNTAQEWFSLALTDPALFHTILCGSAFFMDNLTGRRDSVERFTHMKESVHLLNIRLQVSTTALLDSTLLAVALLAEIESAMGNIATWELHMAGLHKMVQLRGGLSTLEEKFQLKVLRADLAGSIITLSPSRFLLPFTPTFEVSTCDLPAGIQNIIALFTKDSTLISILTDLNSLASLPQVYSLGRDRALFALQHRLLSLDLCAQPPLLGDLEELCALAILLYLLNSLFQAPFLHCSATTKLLLHLKSRIAIFSVTPRTRDFILWSSFLGAVAANGKKKRAWFVARVVRDVMDGGIWSWEEVRCVLSGVFWVEGMQAEWSRTWEEALAVREVLFE